MNNFILQQALCWLAQCELSFLGRARENAWTAVDQAIQAQAPQEIRKFAIKGVCNLGLYQPPLSEIVLAVKQQRWSRAGNALGKVLGQKVKIKLNSDSNTINQTWIVVPIPTPFLRRVLRGIDHSDIIASALAKELRLPLRRSLWQRFGRTQKTLNRKNRLHRLQRFGVRFGHQRALVGKSVIVVDDIRTTGATIEQASRVLRNAGAARGGRGGGLHCSKVTINLYLIGIYAHFSIW